MMKGDILQYFKDLTASIKNNHALAEQSFHSKLSGYKSLRHHTFQPGDVLCWKRFQKDSLQSHWKGPYQELLINTCAAKLQGTDLCIHITHSVTWRERFPRTEADDIGWDSFPKISRPGLLEGLEFTKVPLSSRPKIDCGLLSKFIVSDLANYRLYYWYNIWFQTVWEQCCFITSMFIPALSS